MTLFKQIAIMLSIFLILILTTVLILNFNSANNAVQERLYEDAKNTATSLSLSLGTANGDISVMSTMINANFDSGNYRKIVLEDIQEYEMIGENILYDREIESKQADIPLWFLNLVHIEAPIASANVSAGWSQVGILHIQSDVSYAYTQLYTILINLLISFSILVVLGLIFLYLILSTILKPLKKVQYQAEAVTRNEFIIQSDIPYTEEFKDVVLGINNMVSKMKSMFEKGNEELKRQKELEYSDIPTMLKNRKYLIDKLPEFLKIDAQSKGGINIMIAFNGVVEANETIGHRDVDKLFLNIANIFKAHSSNYPDSIVARMNGTEFSILLPDCNSDEGLELAKGIKEATDTLIDEIGLNTTNTSLSLGLYEYNHTQNIGQLLSLSDNALSKAKFQKSGIHLDVAEDSVEVMGKTAWKTVINKALVTDSFNFATWTAVDTKNKKIAHNVLSLILELENKTYYYGQFMAAANRAEMSNAIYHNVMHKLFKTPDMRLKNSTCSLRLSYEYLQLSTTYEDLQTLLKEYGTKLTLKLILEIPDKLMRQNSKDIKLYKALFEKYHIEIGIYEFIGESIDYNYLKDLRPVYIKGESSYFLTQSDQGLSALRLITDTLGISLIATGVMDMDTLHQLQDKDIHTIQGRATEMVELK
ncbi:MAG: LapD/MoxY N-terminal periplasmic domain-containing protein [Campylobacterota bacterium]|nr:LapD/MoxY N-terminal periplasmic domain-containing protein [Campylobacterota bacterium]